MPDQLNKQTLINLLIDSPLREPIKINLIDIANNTSDPDLPKIFPTIVKELEIFQKATERRMKLADETIAKLGGTTTPDSPVPAAPTAATAPTTTTNLPPLDLPPLPQPPLPTPPSPVVTEPVPVAPSAAAGLPPLSVPPLDLPPLPQMPTPPVAEPTPTTTASTESTAPTATTNLPPLQSLGTTPATAGVSSDEDALAEIQKELESLKSGIAADAAPAPTPTPQT